MKRNKAKSSIQINNKLIRVTKYQFKPGDETRMHKHEYDYVVTPITNGKLLLIDIYGNENYFELTPLESYFRKAGVEHNVINYSNNNIIFIELELKK